MTSEVKATENNQQEQKQNDKEYNFRAQEAKYERILATVRTENERLQKQLEQAMSTAKTPEEEDNDSEPYVDQKRLEKRLAKVSQSTQGEIQKAMEKAKQVAKDELKQEIWLENNPDFYEVMQNHTQKFMEKAPHLADTILKMPEGFERQKLVYQNIKTLGIDKPEQKQSSIQEKIDSNRKGVFYQPTGIPNTPYANAGDFSPTGQKTAYENLQKLKQNLRLG